MNTGRDTFPVRCRKGWVSAILIPSIISATIGGAVLGCSCGWLLAPSHHFFETIIGSGLIGLTVGFIMAWIGAAIAGGLSYFIHHYWPLRKEG